ncbi:hypothetical protein EV175_007702, partial [Coemansia sp. RSA 1933]
SSSLWLHVQLLVPKSPLILRKSPPSLSMRCLLRSAIPCKRRWCQPARTHVLVLCSPSIALHRSRARMSKKLYRRSTWRWNRQSPVLLKSFAGGPRRCTILSVQWPRSSRASGLVTASMRRRCKPRSRAQQVNRVPWISSLSKRWPL